MSSLQSRLVVLLQLLDSLVPRQDLPLELLLIAIPKRGSFTVEW